jgi:CubicO group peptidase (beta-lactamase class C family)
VSGRSRSLPDRPSLRFLRLEAKRRLAAGEFPTLHEAQAAIAWEHGLPSWAELKQACASSQPPEPPESGQESHALVQLRWLISRFSDAGRPGWTPPVDDELAEHFDDRLLAAVPADRLVAQLSQAVPDLREDLTVIGQAPLEAHVQLAGMRYLAVVDADPPHRLTGLRGFPLAERITDPRLTAPPPVHIYGTTPGQTGQTVGQAAEPAEAEPAEAETAELLAIADDAFSELGLAALVLAGGEPGRPAWVITKGYGDLDRAEVLDAGRRFAAPGVTALVTATAVLRLVAEGRFGLDAAANDHLRTVRLADDAITVRELLSHAAGVDNPAELYADSVPDLVTLFGPVVPCGGPRGTARPSNGGYAVLGQLIADVTGMPYPTAATRLVLDPLGMRDSRFPARAADLGADAVTDYTVTPEGIFAPATARVPTIPAVAGLWSTGADLVRLGTAWPSLLPAALARQALTVQAEPEPGGHRVGLGWLFGADDDTAVHSGAGLDATAFLRVRVRDLRTHVVLTNRAIMLNSIDARLRQAWNH